MLCYKNVCSNESSMLKLKSQLLKIDRNIDYVHVILETCLLNFKT